jgi:hypothetical protein
MADEKGAEGEGKPAAGGEGQAKSVAAKERAPAARSSPGARKIKILGQVVEYPETMHGVVFAVAVCVAIVFVVWIVVHGPAENVRTIAGAFRTVESPKAGETKDVPGTSRLEFWTPSAKTVDFLKSKEGLSAWEANATEERVKAFGELLKAKPGVNGYRRYEVWGHGVTEFKPGWWWVVRVREPFTAEQLIAEYRKFWGTDWPLFVEVLENRASYRE